MKERKLILEPQFEGIYVREEGDEKYGAYIANDRRLRIEPNKTLPAEGVPLFDRLLQGQNGVIGPGFSMASNRHVKGGKKKSVGVAVVVVVSFGFVLFHFFCF